MKYSKKPRRPDLIKESGWTIDDYLQLPEDGNQYEIVNGILEMKPAPTTTHQRLSHKIEHLMTDCCKEDYIIMFSPVDIFITENQTRQPDIVMIQRNREHIIEEQGIVGPPDLVIEIISPSSAKRDRVEKKETYARFGVQEYWIVDPANQTIESYTQKREGEPYELANLFDSEDTVHSERIPCLSFPVKDAMKI